jgi:hypothetical protein
VSAALAGERADGKVQGWHRDRLAVVYVRQSSRQQVADHGESTQLQYGLADRAVTLGWPASRVMVIDEDLGRSAANAAERPRFARLVAELTVGHVEQVLGLEMSRSRTVFGHTLAVNVFVPPFVPLGLISPGWPSGHSWNGRSLVTIAGTM